MAEQALVDVLRDAVVFVLEVDDDEVHPDSTLKDLGIDSLTASQLLIEVEIRVGRELPFELIESIDEVATIADLAAALEADGPPAAVPR